MPKNRFYLDAELKKGETVLLEGSEWHHLSHVMRISEGEEIELVNGRGSLAQATVSSAEKKKGWLKIQEAIHTPPRPPQLLLGIPLLKPSKLEWIVEKGTELGVDAFLFYEADRGEKKGLSENQLERLRGLTLSALKQSGRLFLPSLELLANFETLFSKQAAIYFGDTHPEAKPSPSLHSPALFITGPESGFSESEQKLLHEKAMPVSLNPNILRAETAPIAAAAVLKYTGSSPKAP